MVKKKQRGYNKHFDLNAFIPTSIFRHFKTYNTSTNQNHINKRFLIRPHLLPYLSWFIKTEFIHLFNFVQFLVNIIAPHINYRDILCLYVCVCMFEIIVNFVFSLILHFINWYPSKQLKTDAYKWSMICPVFAC